MEIEEFRKNAYKMIDYIIDYYKNLSSFPVKSTLLPGEIKSQVPTAAPMENEHFDNILDDFKNIILPGITHWQHPSFHAYFPANSSFPSILGEMLTTALGLQCMIWETSPAAAELEEVMMNWLKDMMQLPADWEGVIQDTASTATLCSILTAREKASEYQINKKGFHGQNYRVYCSTEAHSSIEKAVKIAGIGSDNLIKIAVDDKFALIPELLEKAIQADLSNGLTPLCVVGVFGTTSSTAIDPLLEIGQICGKYNIWYHIDAAYSGNALILPEIRLVANGLELADTFVFNPHKWLLTNFDCSAYYVKDKGALIRTFEILPEYLKTGWDSQINNYRDWGIQLGRRFRALKLWFVLRSYGQSGLQSVIRKHLDLARKLYFKLQKIENCETLAPVPFNLICFRIKFNESDEINDKMNAQLKEYINGSGKCYISHTKLNGKYALRIVTGQTNVEMEHVELFLKVLSDGIESLKSI